MKTNNIKSLESERLKRDPIALEEVGKEIVDFLIANDWRQIDEDEWCKCEVDEYAIATVTLDNLQNTSTALEAYKSCILHS